MPRKVSARRIFNSLLFSVCFNALSPGRLLPQCSAVYYFPAAGTCVWKNSRMCLGRGYLKNCFGNWGDKNWTKGVSADLAHWAETFSQLTYSTFSTDTQEHTLPNFTICQNLHLSKKSGLTKSEKTKETSSCNQQTTLCFWIRNNLKNKKENIFFNDCYLKKNLCLNPTTVNTWL